MSHSYICSAAALCIAIMGLTNSADRAQAEVNPKAVRADDRIRTVTYNPNNVIFLAGTLGISTMIVFADDERVNTVAMGDTVSWQAVPDQSKRFLFIKPLERDAVTNMNVVTNKRVYTFVLKASPPGGANVVYKLRILYPENEVDAAMAAKAREMASNPNYRALMARDSINLNYGFKGSQMNKPEAVFDDGVKTYFKFAGEVPAIFVVISGGRESLVNWRREGDVIVVDRVAAQWTLRDGDQVTCLFNLLAEKAPAPSQQMIAVQPELVQAASGPGGPNAEN